MKKQIVLLILIIACAVLTVSCDKVDITGFVDSSDVDDRFEACPSLPNKPDVEGVSADFSFIVISDPHVYHGSHSKLAALKDQLLPSDQFILICGDVTQCGYKEDYHAFYNYLNGFGIPYYPTIGNHDLYFEGWRNYRDILGRPCYTFTAGPARLIALDSANGTLGGKQLNWLKQILKSKTEPLCFVFTHFDFFNPGFTDFEENLMLMSLFENNNINYVFMGHTHEYHHKPVNGVNYVSVPGFEDEGAKNYLQVRVNGGKVTFEKLSI